MKRMVWCVYDKYHMSELRIRNRIFFWAFFVTASVTSQLQRSLSLLFFIHSSLTDIYHIHIMPLTPTIRMLWGKHCIQSFVFCEGSLVWDTNLHYCTKIAVKCILVVVVRWCHRADVQIRFTNWIARFSVITGAHNVPASLSARHASTTVKFLHTAGVRWLTLLSCFVSNTRVPSSLDKFSREVRVWMVLCGKKRKQVAGISSQTYQKSTIHKWDIKESTELLERSSGSFPMMSEEEARPRVGF